MAASRPKSFKRAKFESQRTLNAFFSQHVDQKRRRLVCEGACHQGDIEDGGSQCTCIALSFLCLDGYPKTSQEVDSVLKRGTDLHVSITTAEQFLMVTELPSSICLEDRTFDLRVFEPRSGMVSHTFDDENALAFCLSSALEKCFMESDKAFLTLGNNPGSTLGIKQIDDGSYFVSLDSHSRDKQGKCVPDGKAVVIKTEGIQHLVEYIKDLSHSLSSSDLQFEVTALSLRSSTGLLHKDGLVEDIIHKETVPMETGHADSEADTANTSTVTLETGNCDREEDPTNARTVTIGTSHGDPEADPTNARTVTMETGSANPEADPNNARTVTLETDPHAATNASMSPLATDQEIRFPNYDVPIQPPLPDISQCDTNILTDDEKFAFISNREPSANFIFPPKLYKDKRKKDGVMKRFCNRDWFKTFSFISYSTLADGLFCLACVLFPDKNHRRSKKLITEPFCNWKDATSDLKEHSVCAYHLSSMSRLCAFIDCYKNTSKRIDVIITEGSEDKILANKRILKSIVSTLVFCGRQGIALRSHRDDAKTIDDDNTDKKSLHIGNFKELLNFRIGAGDKILEEHLQSCAKNATYTSKTTQNDFLLCIKDFIQQHIVEEIKDQDIGPYYGIQCDECTDSNNWENLGIVLRYMVNGKPVERLIDFVACEEVTGEAICNSVVQSLESVGLDIGLCRSQTMDGAGNMSGKNKGFAARFAQLSPRAIYHYCSCHDLNLVLCKSCKLKEVHIMLDSIKQLGIFFKYSPKRSRRLEEAISDCNKDKADGESIKKKKFKLFCETRWVEKHTCLDDFELMYEALIMCLEAISSQERGWDTKAVVDANGLLKSITSPTFIVTFTIVHHFFGYFSGISRKLQGTTLDIVQAFDMIESVKTVVLNARQDDTEYERVFEQACEMAKLANISTIELPRLCSRQTQRNNVPASTASEYYKRAVYIPFLDSMVSEVSSRFGTLARQAVRALHLIPSNLAALNDESIDLIFSYYNDDLESPSAFKQEVTLWKHLWATQDDKPTDIVSTLSDQKCDCLMYPNIHKILSLMALVAVSSSSVERANSSMKFIKNKLRSTMSEDRFNALVLMYVHKDIPIDVDQIIDMFARKHPRKMLLVNPLS